MNPELCRRALEKVGNPNILVNLVSRRVRQLNSGGGGASRPLLDNAESLGAADTALTELIEGKMGYETLLEPPAEPVGKRRRRG